MILAAGRGERMRPLSDACPKPLLAAGGKPLIVWQIEALARAGYRDLVINVAHRGDQLIAALRDGDGLGVRIRWSREPEALETAGGIATALPLLPPGPLIVVSGDIWTRFDYATLAQRREAMARSADPPRAHLVMVPNPDYHGQGDFALEGSTLRLDGAPRLTFGNIALYDRALFDELPRGVKLKMLPLFERWIRAGIASGERYDGPWANVGTPADLAALDHALATPASRSPSGSSP
jgi:MurNAc alpha-1-phosphate uridylyltransferase